MNRSEFNELWNNNPCSTSKIKINSSDDLLNYLMSKNMLTEGSYTPKPGNALYDGLIPTHDAKEACGLLSSIKYFK